MDNKIVSTAYVPLQPPYQIIMYDHDVAMQIGTLIVTVQKGAKDYQIETHSHPVVAYENKERPEMADNQLTRHQFLEGAVWNNVEVRDITTVCLAGATLTWKQFLEVLEYETFLSRYKVIPNAKIYWGLKKLGVEVLPPQARECTVHLRLSIQPEESGLALQSEVLSELFLNVSVAEEDHVFFNHKKQTWTSDAWKDSVLTWQEITAQLYEYRHVLRDLLFKDKVTRFTVHYTTDDERFKDIIENLNTSFTELAYLS